MQATKNTFISLLLLILVLGWGFSILIMIKESAAPITVVAFIVPAVVTAVIIYLQFGIIPAKRLRDISRLAKKIENRAEGGIGQIDINDAPKEVAPLIKAVNELSSYFEDRHNQEHDFTANASHELRTPLAGMRLQAEIALKAKTHNQSEKSLRNIIKSVDRGTRLVEQLLTLSRLTADRTNLAMEGINIGGVVVSAVIELSDLAETRQINLKMKEWDTYYIVASEDSIRILINNLLRNAITYCPMDAEVEVEIICENDQIRLIVCDDGPGIPEDKRGLVLERFQKADRGSNIGTGLGLSIVKRIADLHRANLELTDGKNDKGLKVIVTFDKYDDFVG